MAARSYSKIVGDCCSGFIVSAGAAMAQAPAPEHSYRIGPNDILNIFVWKEADLTRDVTVMPDGKITYPLIGEITAQGQTASELKKTITDKLQNFVTAPEVTVIVRESRSQMIYTICKLVRPGQLPLTPNMTVMQALSAAGGFAPRPIPTPPDWDWNRSGAPALIGLGLSEAACGDPAACEFCFQLLDKASVPPEIKDQAPYWYLRSLLSSGQFPAAERYARQQIERMQPPATQGQVSFCVALVREGFAAPAAAADKAQQALGPLGFTGLARLDQLGAVNALIEKYKIPTDKRAGLVLQWAAGQQQFAAAEKSKVSADYQAAAATLQAALKSSEANTLVGPASRCRYALAWCHYRQDDFETAAREFTTALTGLIAARDALAVEAAWMAFASARRATEKQPRMLTTAAEAAKRIQQSFPDHPYAKRAKYELDRLTAQSDPEALAKQLEAIPAGDESYAQARYDLCLLRHRLWSQQRTDPQLGIARFAALQEAAQSYLKTPQAAAEPAQAVQCCLLVADAALHLLEPQAEPRGKHWITPPRVAKLAASDPLTIEYHYRRLELATSQGNADARRQEAQWLTDHATDSPYELAGLLTIANASGSRCDGRGGRCRPAGTSLCGLSARGRPARKDRDGQRVEEPASRLFTTRTLRQSNGSSRRSSRTAREALAGESARSASASAGRLGPLSGRSARASPRALAHAPAGITQRLRRVAGGQVLSVTGPGQHRSGTGAKVLEQFRLLYPDLGGAALARQVHRAEPRLVGNVRGTRNPDTLNSGVWPAGPPAALVPSRRISSR